MISAKTMNPEKIPRAIEQCEATIKKNKAIWKLLQDFKVGDKVEIFGPTNASNPCEILFIGEEKVFCRDKNGGEYAFGLDWNSHLWQEGDTK